MPHWPLILRLLIVAAFILATAWAFSVGQMVLAVIGVACCAFAFHRMFMTI